MGRNSDNTLIRKVLDWQPGEDLEYGIANTYKWIETKVNLNE
jgi:nucleoside-diphosphate-sugar epimerase